MKASAFGASASPSVSTTNYAFFSQSLSSTWNQNETSSAGVASKSLVLTDAIIVTKLTFWVTNAPGAAKSWVFKVRKAQADTTAFVTITGVATMATWSGAVALSAGDLAGLASTPSGTPADAGNVYWTMEYQTAGNFYLIFGGTDQGVGHNSIHYQSAFGGNVQPSSSALDYECVSPTEFKVTKISAVTSSVAPSGALSVSFQLRKNDTVDSGSVAIGGGINNIVGTIPDFTFTAGDTVVTKITPMFGTYWSNFSTCLTVVPTYPGEVAVAFGNLQQPSPTVAQYEGPQMLGSNAWNATESVVALRVGASVMKKLTVKVVTAPGGAASRAFTLQSAAASTPVTASVSGVATTSSNTVNTFTQLDGDYVSIMSVPTSTPAAAAGTRISYVLTVAQPSYPSDSKFLALF